MFTVDLIKFIYKCLSLITSHSRPNGLTGKAMISAKRLSVMSVGKTECSVHGKIKKFERNCVKD